eukprot:6178090-Pleurochrysis_carterae.AAC.1
MSGATPARAALSLESCFGRIAAMHMLSERFCVAWVCRQLVLGWFWLSCFTSVLARGLGLRSTIGLGRRARVPARARVPRVRSCARLCGHERSVRVLAVACARQLLAVACARQQLRRERCALT